MTDFYDDDPDFDDSGPSEPDMFDEPGPPADLDMFPNNEPGLADPPVEPIDGDLDPLIGDDLYPRSADPAIGDPETMAELHHHQERGDTCAIASQEFVLEAMTGADLAESQLTAVAEAYGWYQPGHGTAMADVGNILEAYGVETTRSLEASVEDLAAALDVGEGVIVGLDSDELTADGLTGAVASFADVAGIPGQGADHAVQVTGIRGINGADPVVVLNDPGRVDGAGLEIPLDRFTAAWADTGNFLVTASGPLQPPVGALSAPVDLVSADPGPVLGASAWASSDGWSYIDGTRVDYHGTGGGYTHEV